MGCPHVTGMECPPQCGGSGEPHVCRHFEAIAEWKARSPDEQAVILARPAGPGAIEEREAKVRAEQARRLALVESRRPVEAGGVSPEVRDRVTQCPLRGPEGDLALTEDEEAEACCGGGPELTACSAGKGARPGRVTLRECLACKADDPKEDP